MVFEIKKYIAKRLDEMDGYNIHFCIRNSQESISSNGTKMLKWRIENAPGEDSFYGNVYFNTTFTDFPNILEDFINAYYNKQPEKIEPKDMTSKMARGHVVVKNGFANLFDIIFDREAPSIEKINLKLANLSEGETKIDE